MSRYTESRELVQAIGREILAEGRAVTNSEVATKIHERTGKRVSPNLVSEELQRFWALIGTELAHRHNIPNIPANVATAAQAFWIQAVEAADERWAAEKQDLTGSLEKVQARATAMTTQLDAAHSQYREAESLLRTERASHAQLTEEHQKLTVQAVAQSQAQAALSAKVDSLEVQLSSAQQALAWQKQAHEQEQEAMRERLIQTKQEVAVRSEALDAAQAKLRQMDDELERLRKAREDDHRELTEAKLKAERFAMQLQTLERQERAARKSRAGPTRRRTKP